jgi:hypothetical protein
MPSMAWLRDRLRVVRAVGRAVICRSVLLSVSPATADVVTNFSPRTVAPDDSLYLSIDGTDRTGDIPVYVAPAVARPGLLDHPPDGAVSARHLPERNSARSSEFEVPDVQAGKYNVWFPYPGSRGNVAENGFGDNPVTAVLTVTTLPPTGSCICGSARAAAAE